MLMTMQQAKAVCTGCKLVQTSKNNKYTGKRYVDLNEYSGRLGTGYTVSYNRKTDYYVYPDNIVSNEVYDGAYSIGDAVIASNTLTKYAYRRLYGDAVYVTPIWRLDLDTVTGAVKFKVDTVYKPIVHAGRTLTVYWLGRINERVLRAKIRRKLKTMIDTNKAKLVDIKDIKDTKVIKDAKNINDAKNDTALKGCVVNG